MMVCRVWLTSSIDTFASVAVMKAAAPSDVPRKAISSMKAFVTDLDMSISACEIRFSWEIWQDLQIHADLL